MSSGLILCSLLGLSVQDQEPPKRDAASVIARLKEKGRPGQDRIDKAIDSGAEYVKKQQGEDGRWDMTPADLPRHAYRDHMGNLAIGHTALCLLTLLVAGTDPDDPAIARGFKFLAEQREQYAHTYNCALTLMAVEALVEKKMKKGRAKGAGAHKDKGYYYRFLPEELRRTAEDCVVRLVHGQLEDGGWTYAIIQGPIQSGGTGVQQGGDKAKRAPRPNHPAMRELGADLSNTQYALLGLRSATEVGIKFNADAWWDAAQFFLGRQERTGPKVVRFDVPAATEAIWGIKKKRVHQGTHTQEGRPDFLARGWGYTTRGSRPEAYGAMGTIGVASLVMCKYYLRGHPKLKSEFVDQLDAGIEDGCAWLEANFEIKDNAKWADRRMPYANPAPKIDGYYMYGIERAGILSGVERIGEFDWYALGSRLLIDQQQDDGSWSCEMFYEPKATISTCFAVLFLKRATHPVIESRD